MTVSITRERWVGYRWRKHGLGATSATDVLEDLLLLGLQSNRQSGSEQALAPLDCDPGGHCYLDAVWEVASAMATIVTCKTAKGDLSEDRATMLYPRPDVVQEQVDDPRALLLQTYLRVNDPTTRTQYRDWQEAGSAGVAEL